jgi:hypothetical protein
MRGAIWKLGHSLSFSQNYLVMLFDNIGEAFENSQCVVYVVGHLPC